MRESEQGFVLAEVLISVCICLVLLGTVVSIGTGYVHEAMLEYDAICLAKDLRMMQEEQRTHNYRGFSFQEGRKEQNGARAIKIYSNRYEMFNKEAQEKVIHYCLPGNKFFSLSEEKDVTFCLDGTPNYLRTIEIFFGYGKSKKSRFIIIDRAGRIRIDRVKP